MPTLRLLAMPCLLSGLALSPLAAQSPPASRGRHAASVAVSSQSELVLDNGGAFQQTRFRLSLREGDWFRTSGDAHASLTLEAQDAPLTLVLQWTGPEAVHTIDAANNTDLGGRNTFNLWMHGQGAQSLTSSFLKEDDGIRITVLHLDDHDLEATLEGRVSGALGIQEDARLANPDFRVRGTLKLHRDALPPRILTGSFGECDSVVHDKLVGAEARSASACEAAFDAQVRAALASAFRKLGEAFPPEGWTLQMPEPAPITTTARGTERDPYRIDFSNGGAYRIRVSMREGNPAHAGLQKLQDTLRDMDQVRTLGVAGLEAIQYRLDAEGGAEITVLVNMPLAAFSTFSRERTAVKAPGSVQGWAMGHVQAPTGGGREASRPATCLLFGRWGQPAIQSDEEGESIQIPAAFSRSAPTLSVQNLEIRISGSADLARKVLAAMDTAPILALLPR